MFSTMDLFEPSSSSSYGEVSVFRPKPSFMVPFPSPFLVEDEDLGLGFSNLTLDLLAPKPCPLELILPPPSPFQFFESAIDLIQVERTPLSSSFKRIQKPREVDYFVRSLADRVTALELGFGGVLNARKIDGGDRKYKWTAEFKQEEADGPERKYKWAAEIKEERDKGGKQAGVVEKSYKWMTELKGNGTKAPITQTYTYKSTTATPAAVAGGAVKPKKQKEATRVVEIEDPVDPAALALKQVFEKRKSILVKSKKGKRKELSPQDAALIIQVNYRVHLVRRSQALRGFRDLAVAKAKLKEIRALFYNFSYRQRIAYDEEERQRFSEKIIVLLLTVDDIEGLDFMARSAKRSMVTELEAMLDVVDPQPLGKLGSLKRRKFDLPAAGPVQKEMALGVAGVVQMLDQSDNGSSTL